MTHIIRYADTDAQPTTGIVDDDQRVRPLPVSSISELLTLPLNEIRTAVRSAADAGPLPDRPLRTLQALQTLQTLRILPPVDGLTEVWASGVTYHRSRQARIEESGDADVYARLDDLTEYLFRAMDFPHGAILSTGTGIVPDLELSLTAGDIVRIEIDQIGVLTNPVISVPARRDAA